MSCTGAGAGDFASPSLNAGGSKGDGSSSAMKLIALSTSALIEEESSSERFMTDDAFEFSLKLARIERISVFGFALVDLAASLGTLL